MISQSFFLLLFFFRTVILIHYQKMFNLDDITNENNDDHSLKWSYIPNHPGSGSGKTNTLLNLIKEQDNDSLKILVCD